MIDWVGNHNSFFVPFGQFGMPTIIRTLQPFIQNFLYAISKSDGADVNVGLHYGGTAARNGEPFGELGLVLQHDAAWHEQVGPPFSKMPENLGGVSIDVLKTAGIRPIASPGTDPPVSALVRHVSVPSGSGVGLPSGTNQPGASSTPIFVTGTPGSSVSYKFTEGTYVTSGTGTINTLGTFGAYVDLSAFPDGNIALTVTLTAPGGVVTTLTTTVNKNSVAPPAPVVSAPAYAIPSNLTTYTVNVTGQVGAIATVVLTDSGLPVPNVANGMDVIGSTGSLAIPIDVSNLAEGPVTISVTLTNGAGNSVATILTVTKDTSPPPLSVSAPPYINIANVSAYQPVFTGEGDATATYWITDGTTTLTGSKFFNGSTKWLPSMVLTSLKNGPVTLTVTETEPSSLQTTVVTTVFKDTTAPSGSFAIAGTTINGVVATTNPVLTITPSFTAASGVSSVLYSVNGGAWQSSVTLPSTDGLYTVTALVTSSAGNVATFSKQVRLDRTGPTTSYTITAPTNSGSYDVGQAVTLSFSASDVDNVVSSTAVIDGTTTVSSGAAFNTETLAAGTHTIVITAKDGLGNVSTTTITLTVHTTVAGLMTGVNDGVTAGKITSTSVATQLKSYLTSAQAALAAGNNTLAKSYLASFVSLVQQQSGVTINAAYAALLAGWANDLISRL